MYVCMYVCMYVYIHVSYRMYRIVCIVSYVSYVSYISYVSYVCNAYVCVCVYAIQCSSHCFPFTNHTIGEIRSSHFVLVCRKTTTNKLSKKYDLLYCFGLHYTHAFICMIYIYIYICVCIHVYMYICIHVCMCLYVYIYVSIYVWYVRYVSYVCIYIYICVCMQSNALLIELSYLLLSRITQWSSAFLSICIRI